MKDIDLLDAKQLMRARKLMRREIDGELSYTRSDADFDVDSQLDTLNLAFSRIEPKPDAALRLFASVTSSEFIFASRTILTDHAGAYRAHQFQLEQAACLSFYGFHLKHLEFERTRIIAPKRTGPFTSGRVPGAVIAPLFCVSRMLAPTLARVGRSLLGFHQLASDIERFKVHHNCEDPVQAQTEFVGTTAFAAKAFSIASGYELPAPVVFPDDPGEQGLAESLDYILGGEEQAKYAFQLAMDRHGYRVIESKPNVGLIRWPGMMSYPFEYLILKQIRTCHGLVNPPFEHVLLYPEYEKLHNAFTWFDPREHPVMGQFIRLYEDWSGERFEIAWPPVEIPN